MNKTSKLLLPLFVCLLISLIALSSLMRTAQVLAWFGAGSTPGWPATTTGLRGEIALPVYKFSPDFYTVGDTVTFSVTGFNLNSSPLTSHYWLVINQVTQAPIGTDRTSGDPSTPGLNENQLYDFHQASNDVQVRVASSDLGNITFPGNGNTTFQGTYTTTTTGYFQFDFIDVDPASELPAGHILAAGFIRVLRGANSSPTPTPNPTSSTEPTPTPTPTPDPGTNNNSNNNGGGGGGGGGSAPTCGAQKPPTPTLLSVISTSTTTVQLNWTSVNPATGYSISYGTSPGNFQFGVPNVGNTTSYSIGALDPNQKYYFVVRALNDCMPGDPSNEKATNRGGAVLGATSGQVLGESTESLAATGSHEGIRAIFAFLVGALTFGVLVKSKKLSFKRV
jgi:hypothetical protein